MSRVQRVRQAAERMARVQIAAYFRLAGEDAPPWDSLDERERKVRTACMVAVLRVASEDVLDALLGVGRSRRDNGRTPTPVELDLLAEDTTTGLGKVCRDYVYLFPAIDTKGGGRRRDQDLDEEEAKAKAAKAKGQDDEEQTGAGDSDLASGLGRRMRLRRCVEAAADRIFRARELVLGAEKALADAAGIIDEAKHDGVASIEAIPSPEARENERTAKEAQARRDARAHDPVFSGERAG